MPLSDGPATCHPDRPYYIKGQCRQCYHRNYMRDRRRSHGIQPRRMGPDPEKALARRLRKQWRRTHKPLVGPLENYEGDLTYVDCPHCGKTSLIAVEDRPLACPACAGRVRRQHIWLWTPVPYVPERDRKHSLDYLARLRANDPAGYKALNDRGNARQKARREAMLQRDGGLDWSSGPDEWVVWAA